MLNYTDLFDYFKKERVGLVQAFEKMPNEEFVKNRELSFYSIKDVFLHTIDVEDSWLHYSYHGRPKPEFTPQNFKDIEQVKLRMSEVDSKTRDLFSKLTPQELRKPVTRRMMDGREMTQPMENVLYHIPIEVIHHYGEIFAEFWKANMNAPYTSYLRFAEARASV